MSVLLPDLAHLISPKKNPQKNKTEIIHFQQTTFDSVSSILAYAQHAYVHIVIWTLFGAVTN